MKIYENANDQHVRKVVIYEVSAGLAFDKAGTELLTKEQIVDAFLKGCVVENEGNYKTPTGVNVTDSGAELVFGGGSGGGAWVKFQVTDDGVVADKTPSEVQEMMLTRPVIGIVDLGEDGLKPIGMAMTDTGDNGWNPVFFGYDGDNVIAMIYTNNDDWVFAE